MQAIRVGTYDEVLGPGNTPIWALPTDVMKYQDDQRVSTETGYVLDYRVSTAWAAITMPLRLVMITIASTQSYNKQA